MSEVAVAVAELSWENGFLATILPTAPTKATWVGRDDTLESIVHQATTQKTQSTKTDNHRSNFTTKNTPVIVASSNGKWGENLSQVETALGFPRKRVWSECFNQYDRNYNSSNQELAEPSVCASAGATFCRGKDTTVMTWGSLESPRNLKSKSAYEDSAYLDSTENQETKGEAIQSRSTRRTRVAAVHNQSERKRRERINQKMKALQKLVPNASKTDKASMLDEVIMYLKQLQSQVQMMSMRNNMPQMVMPLGMQQQQQQLQMSLLARMGMGIGLGMNMGMLDMNTLAQCLPPLVHPNSATAAVPSLVTPPFVSPQMIQKHISPQTTRGASSTSVPLGDPYSTFLAQSMNMELYNKMATYHQQVNQAAQALGSDKRSNQVQGQ